MMSWKEVRHELSRKLGVEERLLDLIAVSDILNMSGHGFSNQHIAKAQNVGLDYVVEVLNDFVGFTGWDENLAFSPTALYTRTNGVRDQFVKEVLDITPDMGYNVIVQAFMLSAACIDLLKGVEEYYDNQ